jgi:hypothetical protein
LKLARRASALVALAACMACVGEGEAPDESTTPDPDNPKPLNLTVETPITGTFTGGPWSPAVGAAWYVNAEGKKIRHRFVADTAPDKRLLVKLWEREFDTPCEDAYGSLAANRTMKFLVPAKIGSTRDPDEGFRLPGGLVHVAYVTSGHENSQIADSARVDITEIEPAVRGRLAAKSPRQVDAIDVAGDFAVALCIDVPVTPAAN